jgi:hypothetical protein
MFDISHLFLTNLQNIFYKVALLQLYFLFLVEIRRNENKIPRYKAIEGQ